MKVAHFGNMANDAYVVVKALQQRHYDCDLYVETPQHVASFPQWEDCSLTMEEIGKSPYGTDYRLINKDFECPEWLKFVGPLNTPFSLKTVSRLPAFPGLSILETYRSVLRFAIWKTRNFISPHDFLSIMKDYDVVVTHVPYSQYAMKVKQHYIAFDAGLIRYFRDKSFSMFDQMRMKILEFSYRKASLIMATNIDTFVLYKQIGLTNWKFMPFLINTDRYKPMKVDNPLPYEYVIFHPTRQYWKEKANHLLIQAFAKFHKEQKDSVLVMVNWGDDLKKSKELISKLGLNENVIFSGLMSKPHLIRWFNLATVVADQFILKGAGTTVWESMACSKPTIISLDNKCAMEAYGEVPPRLYGDSVDSILNQLLLCLDKGFREKIGFASREWVLKHHSPDIVAKRHMEAYKGMA